MRETRRLAEIDEVGTFVRRVIRGIVFLGPVALSPIVPASAQSTAVVRGATTVSRARLDVLLGRSASAASEIRVVRPSGAAESRSAAASVQVAPGDLVFRRTAEMARRVDVPTTPSPGAAPVPRVPPSAMIYSVPFRVLTVDAAGVEHVLVPYVILDGGGLSYDVARRGYRGTVLIGVEDSLHPRAGTVPLPQPLRLQFATATGGGRVAPRGLAIGHTGVEYDSVSIESPDSTHLRITTSADPQGVLVPIPVRPMSVVVSALQDSIPAFGLATARIAVTLPRGMSRADTALIVMSSRPASVSPETVRVTGSAPALVRLRSGLPGNNSIRALLDGVDVGGTSVTFVPPWAFVGATVAGLLLGGFARFFGAKRRKRVRALTWDMLRGAPFGFIAAIAGAIGLDLLQLKIEDPGTWVAVMLTAAIGAWVGSRVLERATAAG